MSVHVMSWVFRYSEEKLGNRLVLLVLADKAEQDGTNAWPSVATIAGETRMSERQVQRSLRELEEHGAIKRTGRHRTETQQFGTYVYSVVMSKGDKSAPLKGDKSGSKGVSNVTQTVLRTTLQEEPNGSSRERPRNEVWDTLTEIFGEATTETSRSRRGKVCRSLTSAGATREEMIRRAKSWGRHFDNATLTETALEKFWDTLGQTPMRLEERRGRTAH